MHSVPFQSNGIKLIFCSNLYLLFLLSTGKQEDIKNPEKKTLTKSISKKMAEYVLDFITKDSPTMLVVDDTNKLGYKTQPVSKIEEIGLGLGEEQWNDPKKLVEEFDAEFYDLNSVYKADESKAKYIARPMPGASTTKTSAASANTSASPGPGAVQANLPATPAPAKPDPGDLDPVTDAEIDDRAILIKQQLMAQFRRNTYDKVTEKYVRYHDLADYQQAGITVLFGFDEAEWDVYYPNYKAPGRDETVFDERDDEDYWITW